MFQKKRRSKVVPVLISAAGAIAAFFGVRALMNRFQRSAYDAQRMDYGDYRTRGMGAESRSYQPVDQPDREPIPATGLDEASALARDVTGTNPEKTQPARMPPGNKQSERAYESSGKSARVTELTGPLAEYLLAFHEMIETLRERRRSGEYAGPTNLSMSPEDRTRVNEVLGRLEDSLAGMDPAAAGGDPLTERIYNLVTKVRDAMQIGDYNDDDLFRINGEVTTEVCQLLEELPKRDMQQVREVYT